MGECGGLKSTKSASLSGSETDRAYDEQLAVSPFVCLDFVFFGQLGRARVKG